MLATNDIKAFEQTPGSPFTGIIAQELTAVLRSNYNTRFEFDAQQFRFPIATWSVRKNIQLFLMNYLATKNLVRTTELNDTQWDFLFRVYVKLQPEDIDALLIAVRDRSLPKIGEPSEDEEKFEFAEDIGILSECQKAIDGGFDIYFRAFWAE